MTVPRNAGMNRTVRAVCRAFVICRKRFRNGPNFYGFPHLPGKAG
ncbi:phage BR0599 family protein [Paracoccus sp. (in: a-proteobacteria)]